MEKKTYGYKFKKIVNGSMLEKIGYKDGDVIRVYDVSKTQFAGCRYFTILFKVYDIENKKMVWVDSFTCRK